MKIKEYISSLEKEIVPGLRSLDTKHRVLEHVSDGYIIYYSYLFLAGLQYMICKSYSDDEFEKIPEENLYDELGHWMVKIYEDLFVYTIRDINIYP